MAGEQAFSPLMEEKKQDKGLHQSDEMWSELSNPSGKEFNLPHLANSVSANVKDNNGDLTLSSYYLFDVPIAIEDTFLPTSVDPSCYANLTYSVPTMENSAPTDNRNGLINENNLFDVPIIDGLSLNFDIDAFIKNKKLNVVESSDLPALSSITSRHAETNLTNGNFSFEDRICGSGILQPAQNQSNNILVAQSVPQSGSNGLTIDNSAYSSSGEFRNGTRAQNYIGPVQLNNLGYAMETPLTPTSNDLATQIYPLSTLFNFGDNGQPLDHNSFLVGQTSSFVSGDIETLKYAGGEGERKFTGFGDFRGPFMGSNENPRPTYFNSVATPTPTALPTRQLRLGHSWLASELNSNENSFSIKGKGKVSIPSTMGREPTRVSLSPFDSDFVQQEWGQSCKRFKPGSSGIDNNASQFGGPSVESSSSPLIATNVLFRALEALKEIPIVRSRSSVFKESSSSKTSEK